MDINTQHAPRKWRVRLAEGDSIIVEGPRIAVSDAGVLLVLSSEKGASPVRAFAAGAWIDVEQAKPNRDRGTVER